MTWHLVAVTGLHRLPRTFWVPRWLRFRLWITPFGYYGCWTVGLHLRFSCWLTSSYVTDRYTPHTVVKSPFPVAFCPFTPVVVILFVTFTLRLDYGYLRYSGPVYLLAILLVVDFVTVTVVVVFDLRLTLHSHLTRYHTVVRALYGQICCPTLQAIYRWRTRYRTLRSRWI